MNQIDRASIRPREPFSGNYRQSFQASLYRFLTREKLFHYTWIVLLFKTVVFLGLINNDGIHFSLTKAFYLTTNPLFFLIYISFEVAFLSLAFLFRGKYRYWILVFMNLLLSLLMVADLMNFRAFGNFLSVYALFQTSNLENLGSSIISMLRSVDIIFGIDLLVLVVAGCWLEKRFTVVLRSWPIFLILFISSSSFIFVNHLVIDVFSISPNFYLFRCSWAQNQTMSNLSPLGYHLFDAYRYYGESRQLALSKEEKGEIKAWFANKAENLPDNSFAGLFQGKNLIVLQVESLENFVMTKSEQGQEITPNLNKLLSNSLYFSNYYEQVWNGTSSDADLMTNTSVYPVRQGSTFFRFPGNTYNSLPKILKNHGYQTLAIHPDKGGYWNWRQALTAMEFQKTIDESYFQIDEKIGLGISDGSYLRQVEQVIKGEKQPFYTFLVTLTSHAPFDLPDQYCGLDLDPVLNKSKLGGYFQSIHYTDQQIGNFINKLDEDGLLDNTVIVLYGDHTGVHKFYADEIRNLKNPESWWLEGYYQIPLIIYSKGMEGMEIETTGGQIDLLPTLTYLMGIDHKEIEGTAMGRNLLNTQKDYVVLENGELIGRGLSDKEVKDAKLGLDIGDKIIRSNYFKTYKDNEAD